MKHFPNWVRKYVPIVLACGIGLVAMKTLTDNTLVIIWFCFVFAAGLSTFLDSLDNSISIREQEQRIKALEQKVSSEAKDEEVVMTSQDCTPPKAQQDTTVPRKRLFSKTVILLCIFFPFFFGVILSPLFIRNLHQKFGQIYLVGIITLVFLLLPLIVNIYRYVKMQQKEISDLQNKVSDLEAEHYTNDK